ncbi:MAG TPA: nucleotidyltransferase substrate binding protein [Sphingobacteriaceae bacterium]|nr:nucleotidyltransferase substrate binding protein [Sphingobacteriaceae bacterium]
MERDIRWHQRFANYKKALSQLKKFIDKGELNELEEQGLIQAFEYTYELAWNVIKDYYQYQGVIEIQGSRDAFRLAFNRELLEDGEIWMKMIESRVKTSHTYNEEIADEIARDIFDHYFDAFIALKDKLQRQLDQG